jgi:hypothetical protein
MAMQSTSVLRRATASIALAAITSCAGQPAGSPSATPSTAGTPAAPSAGTAAPASAATQQSQPAPADPSATVLQEFLAEVNPMLRQSNYLGIVELIEQKRKMAGRDSALNATLLELAGTYAPFVGQYQDALDDFAPVRASRAPFDTAAFEHMTDEDAIDAVAELAAGRQAVFVNEAHYMARHRAFTANLLPRLRALGFSYLAVETLADDDTAINTRGYPIHRSGFYSNEPAFGEMLRIALKLGFRLVPYEAPSRTADEREQGQARHIVERILRADPKAKIVVHAGHDHINESGTLAGARPMAVRFRELTGIDPLTVDQIAMTEQSDTTYEDSRYLYLMKHVRRRTPFVLKSGESVWSANPGVHDVTVISPRAVHRAGRPSWIWTMGGNVRRAYIASDEACPGALDCVMTARIAGESDDAVPVDVLRVQFSAPGSRTFALPPGQYVIEARDGSGAALSRQTVTVPAGR